MVQYIAKHVVKKPRKRQTWTANVIKHVNNFISNDDIYEYVWH